MYSRKNPPLWRRSQHRCPEQTPSTHQHAPPSAHARTHTHTHNGLLHTMSTLYSAQVLLYCLWFITSCETVYICMCAWLHACCVCWCMCVRACMCVCLSLCMCGDGTTSIVNQVCTFLTNLVNMERNYTLPLMAKSSKTIKRNNFLSQNNDRCNTEWLLRLLCVVCEDCVRTFSACVCHTPDVLWQHPPQPVL